MRNTVSIVKIDDPSVHGEAVLERARPGAFVALITHGSTSYRLVADARDWPAALARAGWRLADE